MPRSAATLLVTAAILAAGAGTTAGQIPDRFTNLQVLPEDIPRDSLVSLMRSFTFATGLRCDGCHVMGENGSFQGARSMQTTRRPRSRPAT